MAVGRQVVEGLVDDLAIRWGISLELSQLFLANALASENPKTAGERRGAGENQRLQRGPGRKVLGCHSKVRTSLPRQACEVQSLGGTGGLVERADSSRATQNRTTRLKQERHITGFRRLKHFEFRRFNAQPAKHLACFFYLHSTQLPGSAA